MENREADGKHKPFSDINLSEEAKELIMSGAISDLENARRKAANGIIEEILYGEGSANFDGLVFDESGITRTVEVTKEEVLEVIQKSEQDQHTHYIGFSIQDPLPEVKKPVNMVEFNGSKLPLIELIEGEYSRTCRAHGIKHVSWRNVTNLKIDESPKEKDAPASKPNLNRKARRAKRDWK